jgi:hypothetical protein
MGRWRRLEALTQHVVAKADTASATESQTHIPAGQLTSAPAGGVEQHQSTAPHPGRILTDDEKRSLYHNGFVIIRDVVRKDVVQRIHDEIENSPTNSNGRHAAYAPEPACAFCDVCLPARACSDLIPEDCAVLGTGRPSDINSLVFESDLRSILTDLNGHWDRLEDWMWQPAYTPAPEQPIEEALTSPAQYSNGLHVDGRRAIGGPSAIYCDATRTMSIKPFQARADLPRPKLPPFSAYLALRLIEALRRTSDLCIRERERPPPARARPDARAAGSAYCNGGIF